jgi:hypothetical protein
VSTCPRQEEERLLQIVRKGRFEFSSPYWDDISDEAKQLVSDCLQLDPARRPTAEQALRGAWMSLDDDAATRAPAAAAAAPSAAAAAAPSAAAKAAGAPSQEAEMLLKIRALRERSGAMVPRTGGRASFAMQMGGAADGRPSFSAAPSRADLTVQGARFVTLPRALFDELYALCDAQRRGDGEAGAEEVRRQFASLMQTVSLQASRGEFGKVV